MGLLVQVLGRVALGCAVAAGAGLATTAAAQDREIPRPEHPRPDFLRAQWANLNGPWRFAFGDENQDRLDREILVPFCWEAPASGIGVSGETVGWYERTFATPDWPGRRVHLVFGAVDRQARVWVNGVDFGVHDSGYLPLRLDVTDALRPAGEENTVRVRAFDPTLPEMPVGKQINWYTTTSGIWQTVYIEGVGEAIAVDRVHVTPRIAEAQAEVRLTLSSRMDGLRPVRVELRSPQGPEASFEVTAPAGTMPLTCRLPVPEPHLWFPEDPFLYDLTVRVSDAESGAVLDEVRTYFGMRELRVGTQAGGRFVLLNGRPLYLCGALNQSFHPDGIYTYPSEEAMLFDIRKGLEFGLNFYRIHIKTEEPRYLYLCDREGMLLQCDVPNAWRGDARGRALWESAMRGMIDRDYNHPSIFSWLLYNETWGMERENGKAAPESAEWGRSMFRAAKALDDTRLIEDMSPCFLDHFTEETDLVSWHAYGHQYEPMVGVLRELIEKGRPGSGYHFVDGLKQGHQPFYNSEFGGIGAGSGDTDISWTNRWWVNEFRRHPHLTGFIYTELQDIEWEHNGLINYDRSPKTYGYEEVSPGLEQRHIFGPDFLVIDTPPAVPLTPGEALILPLSYARYNPLNTEEPLTLGWEIRVWDEVGACLTHAGRGETMTYANYMIIPMGLLEMDAPAEWAARGPLAGTASVWLERANGERVVQNFVGVTYAPEQPRAQLVEGGRALVIRFAPGSAYQADGWTAIHGMDETEGQMLRCYGAGKVTYRLNLPEGVTAADVERIDVKVEAASRPNTEKIDWPMYRRDVPLTQQYPDHTPRLGLPQTEPGKAFPTDVEVRINGAHVGSATLPDSPADARGILSYAHSDSLDDFGAHGYLVVGDVDGEALRTADPTATTLELTFEVSEDAANRGGLALFGARMGRYPGGPRVVVRLRESVFRVLPDAYAPVTAAPAPRVVLPTAEQGGALWRMTLEQPDGDAWTRPEFDDAAWAEAKSGFGSEGTPRAIIGTAWTGSDIWIRARFTLDAAPSAAWLALRHDEDAEVYLNGVKTWTFADHRGDYANLRLTPEQLALLQPGDNVIAIHCRQTIGGQYIDAGVRVRE